MKVIEQQFPVELLIIMHRVAQPFESLMNLSIENYVSDLTLRLNRSDEHVNSLHNFNEMSVRQVMRMKIIISSSDVDITPNSHGYPTKKSKVLVTRMNVSILRMKVVQVSYFICWFFFLRECNHVV